VRDERGEPRFWQGILLDITERRQAEEQVAEAEERYRTLVEQLPVVTYIDGLEDDATIYISPQIETMLGWTPEEWMGEPLRWERSLHPDDRERVMEADNASNASGEQLRIEHRFIAKDGRVVWVRDQSTLVRDEHGGPRFWQGIYVDITEEKRSEELVREAESRYRTLVETAPAVTYIDTVDEPWEIIYVSPQLEEILGYSPDEWRKTNAWDHATHPDDLPAVRAAAQAHRDADAPYDIEYRVHTKDGRWLWVRDQGRVVRDEEGAPLFFQGMMFDITEARAAREQLREAEERFRVLVEHSPAMLYVETGDPDAASLYVGPQVEQLFGVTPEEYLDNMDRWEQLVHPEDREWAIAAYRSRLASKEPWSLEYRVVRPDGREIWVRDESTVLLDDDGDIRLVQGVIYDITERKIAEQAAQEGERREREAADRLRALDDMKNTFLAAVSHELRSPLTSILGLALTLERQNKLSDDDREDLLARLAGNARKLDRLLKDLLDIDRLSRGIVEPQYRQTDLGALVRRTIESLDAMGGRDIRVQTEPLVIPVDPAKVERIVENLVANAVRHTEADRTVWVRVHSYEGGALLSIEDDGPGVPDDLKQVIFEPFRQGPASTTARANPGTGIGLSLVGRFAELHGGRAWVIDREGGGASFNVFLPGIPPSEAVAGTGRVDGPDAEVLHPFGTADAG